MAQKAVWTPIVVAQTAKPAVRTKSSLRSVLSAPTRRSPTPARKPPIPRTRTQTG
jgi:hypothetical protein